MLHAKKKTCTWLIRKRENLLNTFFTSKVHADCWVQATLTILRLVNCGKTFLENLERRAPPAQSCKQSTRELGAPAKEAKGEVLHCAAAGPLPDGADSSGMPWRKIAHWLQLPRVNGGFPRRSILILVRQMVTTNKYHGSPLEELNIQDYHPNLHITTPNTGMLWQKLQRSRRSRELEVS